MSDAEKKIFKRHGVGGKERFVSVVRREAMQASKP